MNNKVLIVMPAYNAATTIQFAIESIIKQTHRDWILIVIDDCSNDSTVKIIQKYLSDSRIMLYQNNKNMGAYYSRNAGIYLAKDMKWNYFTTHDSDDISYPERLERMIKEIQKPKVNAVKDSFRRVKFSSKREISRSVTAAHAMFDRKAIEYVGYFENVRFGADWEYWERISLRNNHTRLNKTSTIKDILGDSYVLQNNLTIQIPIESEARRSYISNTAEMHQEMQQRNIFYMPFRFEKTTTSQFLYQNTNIKQGDENLSFKNPSNKIAIIILSWQRINLLSSTLRGLSLQTRSDFDVYISNGSDKYSKSVENVANSFSSINKLSIEVSHDGNEYFSFRRFLIAKKIAEKGYETILFLDDDITFPPTYVAEMMNHYEPKTYKSAYSWSFQNRGSDYYKYRTKIIDPKDEPDYCGTGVSMIDASLFLDKGFFEAPPESHRIEDLWLSYYVKSVKKWKMFHIKISDLTIGGADRHALHKSIINNKLKNSSEIDKADFLRLLVNRYGWKL